MRFPIRVPTGPVLVVRQWYTVFSATLYRLQRSSVVSHCGELVGGMT